MGLTQVKNRIAEIPGIPENEKGIIQLLDGSGDMVAVTSVDGPLLFLNESGRILLGIEGEDPQYLYDFHVEDDRQRIMDEVIPEVMRSGSWEGQNMFQTSDGRKRLLKQYIVRMEGSDGNELLATLCRDITHLEFKPGDGSREQIIERERTYQTIFTRNIAGVYRCLVDGIVKECNDAFACIFGYGSADEMIGTRSSNLYFHVNDRRKYLDDLMRTGRLTNYEIRHRKVDGDEVWVLVNAQLVEDEDGHQVIEGTMIDITAQHNMSSDLKETVCKLREMGNNLLNAREMEANRIARDLHDELGQLLTTVKFEISLLKKSLETHSTDQLASRIKSIEDLLTQSMHAVRELSKEIRFSGIDHEELDAVVEHQLQVFEERTDIITHLDVEAYDDACVDEEKKNAVFRIIQEALTNVARHASATVVHVGLSTSDTALQVLIRDNGVGIQPDASAGNTLGVIGMKERVYTYNGSISIVNTGKGTEISVQIPLSHVQNINSR